MKTCKHIALFSIVAVCMLVMQIPFAFAYSSGAASVSVSENSVSAEYTSVDLYIRDGSTYSQITSNSFSDGTLGYTATTTGNVTTYSFSSTSIKLSCDNLYVMIICSDTEKRFGLDPVITESGSFNVTGSTYSMTFTDYTENNAVPGTFYPVTLMMTVPDYLNQPDEPVLPTISVTIRAVDAASASVMDSTNTITAEVVAHYQTKEEATEDLEEINGADDSGAIIGNDDQPYYFTPDSDSGDTTSVYISSTSGGTSITNTSGLLNRDTFDADVIIPAGQSFVVAVILSESWLASAEITLTLKVGDEPSRSVTINSPGTKYVFYRSGSSLSTANNLNNVTWMQYSGNVTITLTGLAQNTLLGSASVSVKLVFQK